MSTEQSPSHTSNPARTGARELRQPPHNTSGVRNLLGLPTRDSTLPATAPLAAPPSGHHYGQPPLPASMASDEGFSESLPVDEFLAEVNDTVADFLGHPTRPRNVDVTSSQSVKSQSLVSDSATHHGARQERDPSATSTLPTSVPAQPQPQSFSIPGVSTRPTNFPALSQTVKEPVFNSLEAVPQSDTVLRQAQHEREKRTGSEDSSVLHKSFNVAQARPVESETRGKLTPSQPPVALPPSPHEHVGSQLDERGGREVLQRLAHLQRTVNELTATVASQAQRIREEEQARKHGRKTPTQPTVIVKRVEAPSTTPRAFWERSRLSRLHLRTGR